MQEILVDARTEALRTETIWIASNSPPCLPVPLSSLTHHNLCKSSKLFLLNSFTDQLLPTSSVNLLCLDTVSRNWSKGDEDEDSADEATDVTLVLESSTKAAGTMDDTVWLYSNDRS
jgi:hypothetical protein